MSAEHEARAELAERIEKIESGYEFLLAYAAQGRTSDHGPSGRSDVRERLEAFADALDGLGDVAASCVETQGAAAAEAGPAFLDALASDAAVTRSAIRLVLARSDISSQLIDNLNASIHVRALLTDLFIVDESLKGAARG